MPDSGVWVTYFYDYGAVPKQVFPDEMSCLRSAAEEEYLHAVLWRFGTTLEESIKLAESAPTTPDLVKDLTAEEGWDCAIGVLGDVYELIPHTERGHAVRDLVVHELARRAAYIAQHADINVRNVNAGPAHIEVTGITDFEPLTADEIADIRTTIVDPDAVVSDIDRKIANALGRAVATIDSLTREVRQLKEWATRRTTIIGPGDVGYLEAQADVASILGIGETGATP